MIGTSNGRLIIADLSQGLSEIRTITKVSECPIRQIIELNPTCLLIMDANEKLFAIDNRSLGFTRIPSEKLAELGIASVNLDDLYPADESRSAVEAEEVPINEAS